MYQKEIEAMIKAAREAEKIIFWMMSGSQILRENLALR